MFEVEAPPMAPGPATIEREAMRMVPRLVGSIRTLGLQMENELYAPRPPLSNPILQVHTALRLSALADSLNPAPQTPVIAVINAHREALLEPGPASSIARSLLAQFAARARNEEHFAAEYAIAIRAPGGASALPLTALGVAVAMRPYAQEEVWYPGFPFPRVPELEQRFGLASIQFGPAVLDVWRPYYQRMLGSALAELHTVLPQLDLRGLHFHIKRTDTQWTVLAFHEPWSRTIYLPPATGAGTIAHEVAHDLDSQVARKRYGAQADYGTDLAARSPRNDGFAEAVQSLPSLQAAAIDSTHPPTWDYRSRPAEIFARNLDWFVVSELAAQGRSNGYLSSVQDKVLIGFGSVGVPDAKLAQAFMHLLMLSSPISEEAKRRYMEKFGAGSSLSAFGLIRAILDPAERQEGARQGTDRVDSRIHEEGSSFAALRENARREIARIERARSRAHARVESALCASPPWRAHLNDRGGMQAAIDLAADAAIRGVLLRYAGDLAGRGGRAWMLRSLYGPAYPAAEVDEEASSMLEDLLSLRSEGALGRQTSPDAQRLPTGNPFQPLTHLQRCPNGFGIPRSSGDDGWPASRERR